MAENNKLCINCIHYADTFLFKHYKEVFCTNELLNTEQQNPVTGGFIKVAERCLEVRLREELCGWEGKWWEPRPSNITAISETKEIAAPISSPRSRSKSRGSISLEDLI